MRDFTAPVYVTECLGNSLELRIQLLMRKLRSSEQLRVIAECEQVLKTTTRCRVLCERGNRSQFSKIGCQTNTAYELHIHLPCSHLYSQKRSQLESKNAHHMFWRLLRPCHPPWLWAAAAASSALAAGLHPLQLPLAFAALAALTAALAALLATCWASHRAQRQAQVLHRRSSRSGGSGGGRRSIRSRWESVGQTQTTNLDICFWCW